jgi:DhnA family fructose-bisphosphate aldolase class Ia
LGRLFGASGKAVVVACDHGEFDGPQPGLADPLDVVSSLHEAVDGVLMSPGTLRRSAAALSRRGAAVPVVRLNWNTVYCFGWSPSRADGADVLSPEDAFRLGADVALISLTLRSGSSESDAANVAVFSRLAYACQRIGLPVIGEYFPLDTSHNGIDSLHDEVVRGARILYELGADAIKTFLNPGWDDVAAACPVPVLALGSERLASDVAALTLAQSQMKAGARGVVFGRNVFQSPNPTRFMAALCQVVHLGADPQLALVGA